MVTINICNAPDGSHIKIINCKVYPYLNGVCGFKLTSSNYNDDVIYWETIPAQFRGKPWTTKDSKYIYGWHLGACEVEIIPISTLQMSDDYIIVKRTSDTIHSCSKCQTPNPYAEPNMPDGTFKCKSCRDNPWR